MARVIVCLLVFAFVVWALPYDQRAGRGGDASLIGVLFAVAGSVFVYWRTDRQWLALGGTTAVAAAYFAIGGVFNPAVEIPITVCGAAIAATRSASVTIVALVVPCGVVLVVSLFATSPWMDVERIGAVGWIGIGFLFGVLSRMRRRYVAAVEYRATTAELMRDAEAHTRVIEERVRIARDLHDVAAHHLTSLNMQIGTAVHLISVDPELARTALTHVHQTTEMALKDIKATVGMLREGADEPALHPVPGMADLDDLLADFRNRGMTIDLTRQGRARSLAPGTDLTAYRIVQESLTNAAKHARGESVRLRLRYGVDTLLIEVVNRAPATGDSPSPGYGLIGMTERANVVGGTLRSIRGSSAFHVLVELPIAVDDDSAITERTKTATDEDEDQRGAGMETGAAIPR